VTMTDPALLGRHLHVVGAGAQVPNFFRHNRQLHEDLGATMRRRAEATRSTLSRLGIAATRLSGESGVVPGVVELLERHRRTKR
jgi:predicted DNA repair protein MutK